MMIKHLLPLLLLGCSYSVCSQSSNNLEKDTALAHQYIREAQNMRCGQEGKLELAEKALAVYEAYPKLPEYVQAKSLYAFALYLTAGEKAKSLALEMIELARHRFQSAFHPLLSEAYLTLIRYELDYRRGYSKARDYGDSIAVYLTAPSVNFFELKLMYCQIFEEFGREANFKAQLDDWEMELAKVPEDSFRYYRMKYF